MTTDKSELLFQYRTAIGLWKEKKNTSCIKKKKKKKKIKESWQPPLRLLNTYIDIYR